MKYYLLLIVVLICSRASYGQVNKYNLNFEHLSHSDHTWNKKNDGTQIRQDSVVRYQGKYSLNIKPTEKDQGMYGVVNEINSTFEGDKIEFKGYLKANEVQNAYFYLIVGNETDQFSFDLGKTISGSTGWEEIKISLPYTPEATKITIACNIEGKGEVWIDDITILINGKNINELDPINDAKIVESDYVIQDLSKLKKERLALLGKLWGFLKYYHPAVSQGKYDWDKELFKTLPFVNDANFELKLENWISSLGDFELSKEIIDFNDIKQKPDFSWFHNSFVSETLRIKLEQIVKAARPEDHYYVQLSEEINSPLFQNEKRYSSINYEDDGMKLLAVFRYWNYIQYFYPYKYLISDDWDNVLEQFIEIINQTKDEPGYTLTLAQLVSKTDDTHHTLLQNAVLDSYLGKHKVPVSAIFINDTLVVANSGNSKIRSGDIIEEIDNIPVNILKEKYYDISVASNVITTLREVAKKIIRTSNDTLDLSIRRGDRLLTFRVPTIKFYENVSNPSLPAISEISEKVGYLNTSDLNLKDYDSIFKFWKDKQAIIFDLRTYPKENLARILPYLSEEPVSFFRTTSGSIARPGTFSFDDPIVFETKNGYRYKGKIIILVNDESQSKSEFSAMALKTAPNSLIIGSQTAGTDGDIVEIILPGNIRTIMTGNGIYHVDKSETQQVGIVPDIKVVPNIKDLRNQTDRTFEVAIEEGEK